MPVYFIQQANNPEGPIKIGWADSPEDRLRVFQCGSPVALTILNTVECAREKEIFLHLYFADSRLHGEWFKPTDELLKFIENPDLVIRQQPRKPELSLPLAPKPEPGFYTLEEIAAIFEVKTKMILRWIQEADLPATDRNGYLLVSAIALRDWLKPRSWKITGIEKRIAEGVKADSGYILECQD